MFSRANEMTQSLDLFFHICTFLLLFIYLVFCQSFFVFVSFAVYVSVITKLLAKKKNE